MTDMYVKAPKFMGRNLSLYVGNGQKTIFDNSILEGARFGKFVGMGFLRKCTSEEVANVLRGRGQKAPETAPEAPSTPDAPTSTPDPAKPPMGRKEMLEAMEADALYKVAQGISLEGRLKLKGDATALVAAILEHEEAVAAEEAAKIEAEAAAAVAVAKEGTITKSPAVPSPKL